MGAIGPASGLGLSRSDQLLVEHPVLCGRSEPDPRRTRTALRDERLRIDVDSGASGTGVHITRCRDLVSICQYLCHRRSPGEQPGGHGGHDQCNLVGDTNATGRCHAAEF
jgi:hypothetical protein